MLPRGAYQVRRDRSPGGIAAAATDGWIVVGLRNCSTKAELMATVAEHLGFDEEFGANWDALNDALSDVDAKVVVFDDADALDADAAAVFADILADLADNGFGPHTTIVCRAAKLPRLRRLPRIR